MLPLLLGPCWLSDRKAIKNLFQQFPNDLRWKMIERHGKAHRTCSAVGETKTDLCGSVDGVPGNRVVFCPVVM